MKVVVAAGGTGGHFYPGLAVARELLNSNINVSFIIKKGDYVLPLLEREKIPFISISAGGFKRSLAPKNILTVFKLVAGFFEAFKFLRANNPRTLLVMGGYLSVAPVLAARLLGIPVVLHEQNVVPGLANRLLSRIVDRVAVSFASSLAVFGPKAVVTGNPVRREFHDLPSMAEAREKWGLDDGKITVLIFGGSLGAQRLNELVVKAFESMPDHANDAQILHITGPSDVTWVRQRYEKTPYTFYVDSYCHDMPAAYAAADLVVARSGASTVSEIMVARKPAIFVPYPLATGGHQSANAQELARVGAARVCEQRNLAHGELDGILREMIEKPSIAEDWVKRFDMIEIDPLGAAPKIARLIREVAVQA